LSRRAWLLWLDELEGMNAEDCESWDEVLG